jgi:hypothetical protein
MRSRDSAEGGRRRTRQNAAHAEHGGKEMVVIEGVGTLSVTEPGHDRGTYYEKAQVQIFGDVVHFFAYGKWHTAAMSMCLIGWIDAPSVRITGE